MRYVKQQTVYTLLECIFHICNTVLSFHQHRHLSNMLIHPLQFANQNAVSLVHTLIHWYVTLKNNSVINCTKLIHF
jgi:hypothetical protein